MTPDPAAEDDETLKAESRAHVALFAHVGVTDLADWRSVALHLAGTFIPEVLGMADTAPQRRKAGRPKKWDEMAEVAAAHIIEEIKKDSLTGLIKARITTDRSACEYFADAKEAASYRDRCQLYFPTTISAEGMQNAVMKARKKKPGRIIKT